MCMLGSEFGMFWDASCAAVKLFMAVAWRVYDSVDLAWPIMFVTSGPGRTWVLTMNEL